MATRKIRRLRLSRDAILFIAGLIGIAYETIAHGGDRPTLLVLFGAMVGLPAFLRTDEAHKPEPPKDEAQEDPKDTKP